MLKTEFIVSGEFQVNCYIVYDETSKKAIIIDPGQDGKKVIDKIEKLNLKPEILINTHGHFDHTLSNDIIRQKYNIPLAIHKDDTEMLSDANKNFSTIIGSPTIIKKADIFFDKEETKETSFCKYYVIHTPGHSKGSVCILIDNILFAGDTIFKNSIGRTDLYGGDYDEIIQSLQKIKKFPPDTIICPGHGPFTTLKQELKNNPYLNQ
ncbi:MBL fold metallo-hydrolase [Candidatus Ruminimicrobiellum ovillum]|uniref:MBL fold metallo-hydrolase n=1 Tax=Candidatus Ruminimicrobiellum ovillum TaxID=1947927 RepID=UPI003559AEAD